MVKGERLTSADRSVGLLEKCQQGFPIQGRFAMDQKLSGKVEVCGI